MQLTIWRLFDSEKYSDAQINCGRTSWNAHQLVICEQSNLGTIMTGPKVAANHSADLAIRIRLLT